MLALGRARACVVIWIVLVRPVRWSAGIPTRIRTYARRAMTMSSAEFPADLAIQMDRWPREVREARVLQHGIGRSVAAERSLVASSTRWPA